MTVSSETNKHIYVGDDATVNFAFSFLIFANTEVEVILTDEDGLETVQTIGTHYTVNAGPWPSGGTVTMITAPATGSPDDELLTVRRKFPYTQVLDYITAGKFPAETHEQGLDRTVVLVQQMKEIVDRSILAQTSEDLSGISLELPSNTNRQNMFLAFDALGNLTVAAGTSANLGPVSAYIDTLLPAVDSAAARLVLVAAGLSVTNLFDKQNTFEYGPNYAAASGTDTYTATLTPTLTVLRTGAIYPIYFANPSTVAAPTLQLEALGAKTLKGAKGEALFAGQIDGNHLVQYDGTDMRALNPLLSIIGTWTPTLQDASESDGEGQTYTVQQGRYVRTGNIVTFTGKLQINSAGTLTGGDLARIAGLPFTSLSTTNSDGTANVGFASGLSIVAGTNIVGNIPPNNTRIFLRVWDATGGTSSLPVSALPSVASIIFSGSYNV